MRGVRDECRGADQVDAREPRQRIKRPETRGTGGKDTLEDRANVAYGPNPRFPFLRRFIGIAGLGRQRIRRFLRDVVVFRTSHTFGGSGIYGNSLHRPVDLGPLSSAIAGSVLVNLSIGMFCQSFPRNI